MSNKCNIPYTVTAGPIGLTGQRGVVRPDGINGSSIKNSRQRVLRADFEPTASTDVKWNDSRLVLSEQDHIATASGTPGFFNAYPYRRNFWNQTEFSDKDIEIPAKTLEKDGEQIIIKMSFHVNDTLGYWRPPILLFDNKDITCRTWFNGINNTAGSSYLERYPYVASYVINLSRISNTKIATVCRIKLFKGAPVNGPVNPNDLDVTEEPIIFFYSNIITNSLNLDNVDYKITYKLSGSNKVNSITRQTEDMRPCYIKDLLVEKIGIL